MPVKKKDLLAIHVHEDVEALLTKGTLARKKRRYPLLGKKRVPVSRVKWGPVGTMNSVQTPEKQLKQDLRIIVNYIQEELERIEREYPGDGGYMKSKLADRVGHMVLETDYRALPLTVIDRLFEPLETTFDEVHRGIRSDMIWQEW